MNREVIISEVAKEYFKKPDGIFDGDVILAKKEIIKCMEKYAKIKMIEENKSLLEMAKLHMDSRAVFVINERISELEK